jgi:hypothetical protein
MSFIFTTGGYILPNLRFREIYLPRSLYQVLPLSIFLQSLFIYNIYLISYLYNIFYF